MVSHGRLFGRFVLFALSAFLVVPGTLVASAAAAPPKPLVMGANYWPPYVYPPGHESAPGLAQVLVSRCALEAGYEVEFRAASIPEIFAGLQDGTFDAHVLSYKADRAEYLVYGRQPLFESAYRPFVAAGTDIEIESIADFDGLRLGHKRDMRYTDEFLAYVDRRRQEGTLVELDSENEIVQQLASGEIDVAVMMLSSGTRRAAALGLLDQLDVLDYNVKTASYPLAIAKHSKHVSDPHALLAVFDECLRHLEDSGEMDAIIDQFSHLFGE